MINIGDRVAYDDAGPLDDLGTVVEPTAEDGVSFDPDHSPVTRCVMVQWDDGIRIWEDQSGLVVVWGGGS